jgi:nitrite reductase/ring-hydroxylating ferredoxin subunit
VLVCHAHGGGFDLDRGGKVLCGPPKEPLKAFKCQEENGEVFVIID